MGHANTVAETGGFDNGKGNEQPQSLIKKLSVDDVLDSSRQIQPAMDLSRDKNAEEMKWSLLEMGAAMQAHGA